MNESIKAGDRVEMTPEARAAFRRRRSWTGTVLRVARRGSLIIKGDGYKNGDYWAAHFWRKVEERPEAPE